MTAARKVDHTVCQVCNESFEHLPAPGKKLSQHLKRAHCLTAEEYTVKHLHGGQNQTCQICEETPRFASFSFKKFCRMHAKEAESTGGKKGGKSPAWNKGKTAEDDPRIERQAKNMLGSKNPFFGKKHTLSSRSSMTNAKTLSEGEFLSRIALRCDVSLVSDYNTFEGRQDKNITLLCQSCKQQFETSMVYIERGYACPHCYVRINPFRGKQHTGESKDQIAKSIRLPEIEIVSRTAHRSHEFVLLTPYKDYTSRQDQYLQFKCLTCGTTSEKTLQAFERGSLCKTCFPSASQQQLEVADFIRTLSSEEVHISDRRVIPPLELDIWVPSKQIAIEYHGLYWHSGGRDATLNPQKHRDKYLACKKLGIRLIQIFSDEWLDNRAACESVIRHAIGGATVIKLNARDCAVQEVDSKTAKSFFDACHMAGSTNSTRRFALNHKLHGTVGMVSVRRPIQKKHGGNLVELARMAFTPGFAIRGGASKMLSAIRKSHASYDGLLSYAELRYGEGETYSKCGFKRLPDTTNNYWYTDGTARFNRFKFRAQPGKSEKDVARDAGVRAVYGCGNGVYLWDWI